MADPVMAGVPSLQPADLGEALRTYGGEQARIVAGNPKLLKATFDLLKATASGDGIAGGAAALSSVSAGAKAAHAAQDIQQGARAASFVMSTFKISMEMAKVVKLTSPGAALAYVTATTAQKTGLAVSLVGGDSEKAKCVGAMMELAGSSAAAIALAPVAAPTGVLLVLTLASLTASAYNASQACSSVDWSR